MQVVEYFQVILDYEVTVDESTGELETRLIKKSIDKANFKSIEIKESKKKPKKTDESSIPQLILEDNKFILNSAAIELMQITTDDKIDIKYEKNGKEMIPVIGSDSAFGTKQGCKLTKSNTVSCRGSKNLELSKYGSTFEIIPHHSKPNLFMLKGDSEKESSEENSDFNIEDVNESLPLDTNIEDLIDDKDANITEIDANFFVL